MMREDDPNWRWREAACAGVDDATAEIFFPKHGRPAKDPEYKRAFCGTNDNPLCPIRHFCLSYAIVHDEEGVWGGMTKADREKLGPEVKERLTTEAKRQRWYEYRPSVDEILRRRPAEPADWAEVPIQKIRQTPVVVQVTVVRTVEVFLPPLEELLEVPLLPSVLRESYVGSIVFPSDLIAI